MKDGPGLLHWITTLHTLDKGGKRGRLVDLNVNATKTTHRNDAARTAPAFNRKTAKYDAHYIHAVVIWLFTISV